MSKLTNKIINKYQKNRLKSIVKKINSYENEYSKLSDDELKNKTNEFKNRYQSGESLDKLLPEAFAAIKEADFRVLGMKPFDVQLMGGIVLHEGNIAEMRTGEGKTLVATLPVYLNALTGKGVHVVTVNEYLAQRDAEEMGQVYNFMGLTTSCVLNKMKNEQRKEAYNSDITYLTNNELGFDYLRDNMVSKEDEAVQRDLNYVVIDEVDSILIDEARTPLIISGLAEDNSLIIRQINLFVSNLEKYVTTKDFSKIEAINGIEEEEKGDYVVNLKSKSVTLTESGIKKAEQFFHIDNLADPDYTHILYLLNAALRAYGIMRKDREYVVRKGEILIVDEFTGRIMDGRRYSDGIHQAIEAKEGVEIKPENQTLATITYQNLFNKYTKKSGMTGTGMAEKREFKETYGMNVVQIPTNKPILRKDREDIVYPTLDGKYKAIIKEIKEANKKGQPVLVGTADIETSEHISEMLRKENIVHHVLNAKNDEKEAEIIEQAGKVGKVTVATNMAGRGTDIKLEDKAKELGGLKVIGTERHESRRIDDQLRGRSGRQGDPGESIFFLSLEDKLLKIFGSEKKVEKFEKIGEVNNPITHKYLTKIIESAQKKIEGNNFGIRKNLLEYDIVNNEQREKIYKERKKVLAGEDISKQINKMVNDLVKEIVDKYFQKGTLNEENEVFLKEELKSVFNIDKLDNENLKKLKKKKVKEVIKEKVLEYYKEKEEMLDDDEQFRMVERQVLLKIIDAEWKKHLDDLDSLRQWVGIRGYAQKDPKLEYKRLASKLFQEVTEQIRYKTIKSLYNMPIYIEVPRVEKENKVIYETSSEDEGVGFKISVC